MGGAVPTKAELVAANCWFDGDRVAREPEVTAFKQRSRLHQATWRVARGLPMGAHRSPNRSGSGAAHANGSKLGALAPQDANFLAPSIVAAVEARLAEKQPHQTLDEERLRRDLLSSMPMCFNLFGDVHGSPERSVAAARALWPDLDVAKASVRFEWSPNRQDPTFTGDRTAFDAAFELDATDGTRGIVGVETKYHEHALAEKAPDEKTRMPRYEEITERSGCFAPNWADAILDTDLQQIWRDHLLVLSMLQAEPGWVFGRYVLVHPAGNPSFAEAASRYRELLIDDSTFEVRTIEDLLDAHVLHDTDLEAKFRERYLFP